MSTTHDRRKDIFMNSTSKQTDNKKSNGNAWQNYIPCWLVSALTTLICIKRLIRVYNNPLYLTNPEYHTTASWWILGYWILLGLSISIVLISIVVVIKHRDDKPRQ